MVQSYNTDESTTKSKSIPGESTSKLHERELDITVISETGDISVHSEQQQLFRMEQGLERANTSRKIVTERIYAQGTEREEKWNFNEGSQLPVVIPFYGAFTSNSERLQQQVCCSQARKPEPTPRSDYSPRGRLLSGSKGGYFKKLKRPSNTQAPGRCCRRAPKDLQHLQEKSSHMKQPHSDVWEAASPHCPKKLTRSSPKAQHWALNQERLLLSGNRLLPQSCPSNKLMNEEHPKENRDKRQFGACCQEPSPELELGVGLSCVLELHPEILLCALHPLRDDCQQLLSSGLPTEQDTSPSPGDTFPAHWPQQHPSRRVPAVGTLPQREAELHPRHSVVIAFKYSLIQHEGSSQAPPRLKTLVLNTTKLFQESNIWELFQTARVQSLIFDTKAGKMFLCAPSSLGGPPPFLRLSDSLCHGATLTISADLCSAFGLHFQQAPMFKRKPGLQPPAGGPQLHRSSCQSSTGDLIFAEESSGQRPPTTIGAANYLQLFPPSDSPQPAKFASGKPCPLHEGQPTRSSMEEQAGTSHQNRMAPAGWGGKAISNRWTKGAGKSSHTEQVK
ncbi:hypothetical protein Anapl_05050 [Anas platyrhynchos]|uniref:Uncharacterized protein n=1 Tax=Anas platyrhynchos TaxID=8839 RepID=R0KVC2_ANAPL|nr:hypothetical protein Anapl_05050 [Anas platyrhynchos]